MSRFRPTQRKCSNEGLRCPKCNNARLSETPCRVCGTEGVPYHYEMVGQNATAPNSVVRESHVDRSRKTKGLAI